MTNLTMEQTHWDSFALMVYFSVWRNCLFICSIYWSALICWLASDNQSIRLVFIHLTEVRSWVMQPKSKVIWHSRDITSQMNRPHCSSFPYQNTVLYSQYIIADLRIRKCKHAYPWQGSFLKCLFFNETCSMKGLLMDQLRFWSDKLVFYKIILV